MGRTFRRNDPRSFKFEKKKHKLKARPPKRTDWREESKNKLENEPL